MFWHLISVWKLGRLVFSLYAVCLLVGQTLPGLEVPLSHILDTPQQIGKVAVTKLSHKTRTAWTSPEPAEIIPNEESLVLIGASIMDQRSTWGEGSRSPYYVHALFYTKILAEDVESRGPILLRGRATWPKYPRAPPVDCRIWAYQSNHAPTFQDHGHQNSKHMECDIPESIAHLDSGPPAQLDISVTFEVARWNETTQATILANHQAQGQHFEYPKESLIKPSAPMKFSLQTEMVDQTALTLCAPPMRNYDHLIGDLTPLRFVEYRLHWRKLGVERFVWYCYRHETRWIEFIQDFVKTFDNKDEIKIIDNVHVGGHDDVNVWVADCLLNYRSATEYIVIFDLDEVIALKPAHYDEPAQHLREWLDSWKPGAGSYAMLRQDLSMAPQMLDHLRSLGSPKINLLATDIWTAINKDRKVVDGYLRKTIHRATSVADLWIHNGLWYYPQHVPDHLPLPIGTDEVWPHPSQEWWKRPVWTQEIWNEDINGVADYRDLWPRAYHYRWWGGVDLEGQGSPLPSHPHWVKFREQLKEQVVAIGEILTDTVSKKMGRRSFVDVL